MNWFDMKMIWRWFKGINDEIDSTENEIDNLKIRLDEIKHDEKSIIWYE